MHIKIETSYSIGKRKNELIRNSMTSYIHKNFRYYFIKYIKYILKMYYIYYIIYYLYFTYIYF